MKLKKNTTKKTRQSPTPPRKTKPTPPPTLEHRGKPSPQNQKMKFKEVADEAAGCILCPRMAGERAVLSENNGSLASRVVFVAEAPGRFGSGRTGIPFYGDKSGDNFQELIDHVGLSRQDIFITNAVLCNPLSEGVNSRPTAKEMTNCSPFLKTVLELIAPELVVTLGGVGLSAINRLLGTRYKLNTHSAQLISADNFQLLPLYHPSPRVANWRRPLAQQKKDFQLILKALHLPS